VGAAADSQAAERAAQQWQAEGNGSRGADDEDGEISLAQGSRGDCTADESLGGRFAGQTGCGREQAARGVRLWADLDAENTEQHIHATSSAQHSGMWSQTGSVTKSNAGQNSDAGGRFNCGWLDMDCVDPGQPTQAQNVGTVVVDDGNVNWRGTHSGRMQSNRIDVDEYVEPRQDNVDVGLSLHGQFY
jgi:hypothetical protein